jgi:hypothetical protein
MAPLRLGGIREKKSTPRIGWEVPVKSQYLERGRSEGVSLYKDVFSFIFFCRQLRYFY